MRRIILIALFLCSQAIAAGEWSINVDRDRGIVDYQKEDLKFSYPKSNVAPEVLETKTIGGFKVVVFLARTSGSFVMFEEWFGAVFDGDKLKGIYPYNYEVISEAPKRKINQPKWVVSGQKLVITDPEQEIKVSLDIP